MPWIIQCLCSLKGRAKHHGRIQQKLSAAALVGLSSVHLSEKERARADLQEHAQIRILRAATDSSMAYENVIPCWPSSSSAASSSSSASRVWQSSGSNKSSNALLAGGSLGVCSNIDGKAHSHDVYGNQGGVRFASAGSASSAGGCSPALIRQNVVMEGLSSAAASQRQRVPLAEQQYEQQQRQQQQQQVMGLKLGKRTYHEDSRGCSLVSAPKKQRAPAQPPAPPTCQVEGCKADLTESKGYHRRHRVCQMHSKTPKNMVDGIEQRFCQQCSRFHVLVEFDDGKRSCRRRLAGHNERRRKPSQPEPYTLPAALGCGSIPIFPGAPKGMMQQQQHQQHLLDGTFLLNNVSWPCTGLHKLEEDSHIGHARTPIVINTSSFYAQNRSKQEMAALQDSIANQGVYQFLLAAGGGGDGGGGHQASSLSTTPPEPGAVLPGCAGALSLLSAEPSSGSAVSSPFAQLQLQPTGYHHHHHQQQQQQQQNQFNDFLQFQKALQPLPGFDLGIGAPRASAATTVGLNLSSSS